MSWRGDSARVLSGNVPFGNLPAHMRADLEPSEYPLRAEVLEVQRAGTVPSGCVHPDSDHPRNHHVVLQDAARARLGEPSAPSSGRGPHPHRRRPASSPRVVGPRPVGVSLPSLEGVAGFPGDRPTGHGNPVASRGIQPTFRTFWEAVLTNYRGPGRGRGTLVGMGAIGRRLGAPREAPGVAFAEGSG